MENDCLKVNTEENISIILPNFNSSKFLEKTINSIVNQTFKNWKLIIIDDCSDFETIKILKKYEKFEKIKITYLEKNKGAAYCRNLALKSSKSDYVAFIDSDDLWISEKLEKQLNFMKKNNYKFTYTYYDAFKDSKISSVRTVKPREKYNFKNFIKDTSIATSTMMIKGELARKFEFTDTKICEDYFYKCCMLKEIDYAHCLNQSLTLYRIRKDSMQSNKIRNLYWIWKINKEFNRFNFLDNLKSVSSISFSSLKKYGLK